MFLKTLFYSHREHSCTARSEWTPTRTAADTVWSTLCRGLSGRADPPFCALRCWGWGSDHLSAWPAGWPTSSTSKGRWRGTGWRGAGHSFLPALLPASPTASPSSSGHLFSSNWTRFSQHLRTSPLASLQRHQESARVPSGLDPRPTGPTPAQETAAPAPLSFSSNPNHLLRPPARDTWASSCSCCDT